VTLAAVFSDLYVVIANWVTGQFLDFVHSLTGRA
jgi:hypothetical protein